MADLKDTWKDTGHSFKDSGKSIGHAFRDLGKSMINTVATGAEKATDWASRKDDEDAPAEEAKDATVTAPVQEAAENVTEAIDAEIIED